MPLHHYLPATYLAGFSIDEDTSPRRDRRIFIGDKKSKEIFPVTAGNAGAINNLYSLIGPKEKSNEIEEIWAKYETNLHTEIHKLINRIVEPKKWIRLLVPFIACMLVRGPDFNERFKNRISKLLNIPINSDRFTSNYINEARMLELQRIIGPTAVANWIVIKTTGRETLITNDLGYSPFAQFALGHYGMAIPLNKRYILAISPRFSGSVLHFNLGMWRPIITYLDSQPGNEIDLNNAIAQNAQRFIFCPTQALAEKYIKNANFPSRPIEPIELGFLGEPHATAHEFTWHRLVTLIENNPRKRDINSFSVNLKAIQEGWHSYLFLPMNHIEFPSPLSRVGDYITCNFYNPEIYLTLNRVVELERINQPEEMLNEANIGFQNAKEADLQIEFLFSISIAFHMLGYSSESTKILDFLIETKPDYIKARINRVSDYIDNREFESAYKEIKTILKIDPKNILAHVNLAKYFLLIGEGNSAIQSINKVINDIPRGTILNQALFLRGMAYVSLRQFAKGIIDFSEVISNNNDKKLFFIIYFKRAEAIYFLFSEKKTDLTKKNKIKIENSLKGPINKNNYIDWVISDLSKSKKYTFPNDELINYYKFSAKIFLKKDRFIDSYNNYMFVYRLNQTDPEAIIELSRLLILIGKNKKANKLLTKSITTDKSYGEYFNNRGITYFLNHDFTHAKKDFHNSIRLFGQKPESGSPLRYLAQISLIENNLLKAKKLLEISSSVEPKTELNFFVHALYLLYKLDFHKADKLLQILSNDGKNNYAIFRVLSLTLLHQFTEAKNLYSKLRLIKTPKQLYSIYYLHKICLQSRIMNANFEILTE